MDRRLEFHQVLINVSGITSVYYQPPEDRRISYPAIVYSRTNIANRHSDNHVYNQDFAYSVTVIDPDPDSKIVFAISKLDKCQFNRHYVADGLNHDVFTIFY